MGPANVSPSLFQPKGLQQPVELDDGDGDGRLTAGGARAAARAPAVTGASGGGARAGGELPPAIDKLRAIDNPTF
ncbi:unnamed protein product, partial [Iphiclides podalirius]